MNHLQCPQSQQKHPQEAHSLFPLFLSYEFHLSVHTSLGLKPPGNLGTAHAKKVLEQGKGPWSWQNGTFAVSHDPQNKVSHSGVFGLLWCSLSKKCAAEEALLLLYSPISASTF